MTLEEDLAQRVKNCRGRARANYFTAYALLIIAVVASASATISVAAGTLTPTFNAILAVLPGIIVLVMNTFKFEERADWWWGKYYKMDELYRGLRHEHRNETDVSKELTSFLKEHEAKWPSFGKPPSGSAA